jgi:signal transduction histidine kinase
MYFSPRLKFIQKHYELPLVAILAVIANIAATTNIQLTGGGEGFFFFSYFTLFIAMAVYFPGSFRWILFISFAVIIGYIGSEWWMGRNLHAAQFTSNLIYLIDAAFLSIVGNRLFYQFFVRDKQNQIALEEANAKLQELDHAKSNFLATISHELKTPMTLIVNPIEQALTSQQDGGITLGRQEAEVVRRNTYRLATLVGDLIEISRGEVGKKQLVPSEIADVKKHFSELFEGMKPLFEEKSIRTEIVLGDGLQPHYFDIKKMDKVVYNLLSNALKFTPQGGKVTMKVWDDVGAQQAAPLRISVSDTGIGIPADKLGTIFERFMQVEEGTTRSFEGMGIGLSLVKDFVEQHGGTVEVKSVAGKGTTFTVTLPRGKEHFTVPMVESSGASPLSEQKLDFTKELIIRKNRKKLEEAPREEGKKTVLVVDDNSDICLMVERALSADYNIVFASNGKEGLEKALEAQPDLIVSDIMMPVMDGYQMLKALRKEERFQDLPVILLTAKTGEEGLAEGFQSGANDYLTKPFSSSELKLRVQNHLERQDLKAELVRQQNLASVGTLSAGISHNMNTYAASVGFGLELVMSTYADEEKNVSDKAQREIGSGLKTIQRGLQSIREMIKALEIYSQKNREGFKEADIVETTQSVINLARAKIPTNISLELEAPESLVCYFNPHVLNPALMNLIDNAADACADREKGEIKIFLSNPSRDIVQINVQDNGPGIPRDVKPRVWDPFFSTKDVGKGTGLGLWMVRRAVELGHGGKVGFETGDAGTTFFLSFPARL